MIELDFKGMMGRSAYLTNCVKIELEFAVL